MSSFFLRDTIYWIRYNIFLSIDLFPSSVHITWFIMILFNIFWIFRAFLFFNWYIIFKKGRMSTFKLWFLLLFLKCWVYLSLSQSSFSFQSSIHKNIRSLYIPYYTSIFLFWLFFNLRWNFDLISFFYIVLINFFNIFILDWIEAIRYITSFCSFYYLFTCYIFIDFLWRHTITDIYIDILMMIYHLCLYIINWIIFEYKHNITNLYISYYINNWLCNL